MPIAFSAVDVPQRRSIEQTCDRLAVLALGIICLTVMLTFRDYGMGWDDYTHSEYADLLIAMYRSGFTDRRALSFANLYMYGGGFDMIAALLHKVLPFGLFETRRLVGGLVGIIGIAATWRTARHIGGPIAGLAGLLLLALCPVFYGHMFMNPKDAPFAVAMAVLLLAFVRIAGEYPAPRPSTIALFGIATGLAIGLRVLGGLAALYAAAGVLPLLIADIRTLGWREAVSRLARVVYVLIPGLILGYLVMGLTWPWSVLEPLNPLAAITYFSAFFEAPWRELFAGELVLVPSMPWTYLPTLFSLQMPELLLALSGIGAVGTIIILFRHNIAASRKAMLIMVTTAAFLPLAFAMAKHPAFYNGIRHFIFVIPPMAALGGVAAGWIIDRAWSYGQPALAGAVSVIAVGLISPLIETIRLHPYQYSHFNHIAGGVAGAEKRYMLDFWGLSFKQASEGLLQYLKDTGQKPPEGRKWKVAVCGPQRPPQVDLGPDFITGWESENADFAMMLGAFYCRNLNLPVVVDIKREGVTYTRIYDIRGIELPSVLTRPGPS